MGFVVPLALDFNSDYMKVRLRRAQCYEHEDRLEEALEGTGNIFKLMLPIYFDDNYFYEFVLFNNCLPQINN